MDIIYKKSLVFILTLALILPWPVVASADPMTPAKEKELGQRFHLKVAATGALMDDPIINKYYKSISNRIMKAAGVRSDQYNFYILNSDGINAFAVPGGYIYMHTETIISLENEGQLASIVGHEVAHITSRHFARRMESSGAMSIAYMATMLAGLFVASQGGASSAALGQALMIGGVGATVSSMLANSRSDESEADSKGRQYMSKAGYNPRDIYGAFKIMADKTFLVSPNSNLPTYLTTHPALTSRLATSFQDLAKLSPSPHDPRYQAFRDRVLALSGEPRRVQTVMTRRLNANQSDHSAIHALGLLAARQQNLSQADKLMAKAIRIAPGNKEYLADLGDLSLRRRKPEQALQYYRKAGSDNRQAIYGLARASDLLGQKKSAARYYDQSITMEPEPYPEALQLGGRFFGRIGQKSKGHYYLAQYFASVGNLDQAIFHLKEVPKQSDTGVYRARADRELILMKKLKKDEDD